MKDKRNLKSNNPVKGSRKTSEDSLTNARGRQTIDKERQQLGKNVRRPRDFTVESTHGDKQPRLGDKH